MDSLEALAAAGDSSATSGEVSALQDVVAQLQPLQQVRWSLYLFVISGCNLQCQHVVPALELVPAECAQGPASATRLGLKHVIKPLQVLYRLGFKHVIQPADTHLVSEHVNQEAALVRVPQAAEELRQAQAQQAASIAAVEALERRLEV